MNVKAEAYIISETTNNAIVRSHKAVLKIKFYSHMQSNFNQINVRNHLYDILLDLNSF